MTRRSIWLAILALCLAQAFAAQCSNDSCLSAIRTAPTGRNATADCLSFLAQATPTGIPSRTTTTTTVTSTKSVATLTPHRSATVTRQTGRTSPITSETEHNGNHKRTEVKYNVFNGKGLGYLPVQALQERRVTTSPTSATLPLYAKKCALEADYSSACSCLGLSRITRAAAQPVTTKTVTAIWTVSNVTLPPFFTNSTSPAGYNGTGPGTGTVASTIYTGRKTGSSGSLRPTTLFTSRVTSSKGSSSGSELSSVFRTATFSITKPSTIKPTVHVVTIATLTTTKESLWVNTTSTRSYPAGKTTVIHYTNSTAALATASANITTSSSWLNATTSAKYPISINSTASWYNGASTSSLLPGTGTGVVKTTASVKFTIPKNSTASWYNGTSTSFRPLGTGTGVVLTTGPVASPTTTAARFPFPLNTTTFWSNGTATTAPTVRGTGTGTGTGILVTDTGYYNTSTPLPTTSTSTSTTSAKPTATTQDLTCGETSTPFSLRVSQPGGTFDNWFVHVVGNGLLFTSSQSLASSFSVEGTGHLCAVGYNDGSSGRPRIAAVGVAGAGAGDDGSGDGTGEGSGEGGGYEGPVWMLRQGTLKAYWEEDYTALECTRDGGLSCKPANSTSGAVGRWVGCGVQLSLGSEGVGAGGVNCTSVSLEVVES